MHCYFVLAGDAAIPILYHVERVREGKSFMTRTVQARQRGKCIFTTTASFVREGSGGVKTVDHSWDMPEGVHEQLETMLAEDRDESGDKDGASLGVEESGPFITKRLGIANRTSLVYPLELSPRLTPRSRTLPSSPHQKNSPMVASARPDFLLGGHPRPPLRPRLHVRQLLYRHREPRSQPLALCTSQPPCQSEIPP